MRNKNKNGVVEVTCNTYDTIAKDYSHYVNGLVSGWIGKYEKRLLDRFLMVSRSFQRKTLILDIGCGNGKDTHYLIQRGAAVVGIDISAGMLKEAQKHVPDGTFYQMDMRNLSFSGGAFDGVWANGCVYHVPKIDFIKVLKGVLRILRPLGTFSFNFKVGVGERMEENPRSFRGSPRFYAYYTIEEMKKLLQEVGFEITEVRKYPKRILGEKIVHAWAMKPLERCNG